jgi:hypothetical protein
MNDFLTPSTIDTPDNLTSVLESLPSYEDLTQSSDEPAVFDDEQEPPVGLIDLIRRNSEIEGAITNLSETVRTKKLYRYFLFLYLDRNR